MNRIRPSRPGARRALRPLPGTAALSALVAALAALPAPLRAQAADSAAFVTRLGIDTLAVERFVRSDGRVEARTLLRAPRTRVGHYVLETDDAGLVRYEGTVWNGPEPEGDPLVHEVVERRPDGFHYVRTGARATERTFQAEGDVLPFIDMIHWPFDLMLARAARAGEGEHPQPLFSGGRVLPFVVINRGGGRFGVRHPTRGTMDVWADDEGRLQRLDAGQTTRALTVERVRWIDLPTLARRYAAADAAGRSFGDLSGRGETHATVHGADITIDYGRPHKRGRRIFGGLLKWDAVWRTGANRATHFTTTRDLVMGDLVVPAGTYTLFTRPRPDGGVLMINTRTDINGQQYDPDADLGHVPMTRTTGGPVVEVFTIRVRETPDGGVLELAWDQDVFSVPFTVR